MQQGCRHMHAPVSEEKCGKPSLTCCPGLRFERSDLGGRRTLTLMPPGSLGSVMIGSLALTWKQYHYPWSCRMKPVFAVLVAVACVLAGVGIALSVAWFARPYGTSSLPSFPSTSTGNTCYVEVQPPNSPILWIRTPKTGGDESCQAIVSSAQSDSPAGTIVFQSRRPSPSVIIYRNGSLAVLAIPGTVSPAEKARITKGLNRMLGKLPVVSFAGRLVLVQKGKGTPGLLLYAPARPLNTVPLLYFVAVHRVTGC